MKKTKVILNFDQTVNILNEKKHQFVAKILGEYLILKIYWKNSREKD